MEIKNHDLPLARIKKIMKSDEDVSMISSEAPILFAKACELFVLDLTLRAWEHTDKDKRRTLQRSDIARVITETPSFDFLIDLVSSTEPSQPRRMSISSNSNEFSVFLISKSNPCPLIICSRKRKENLTRKHKWP